MGQCIDCPRLTDAVARCCLDEPVRSYTFKVEDKRQHYSARDISDTMLMRIPGRSAERGEVTHKTFKQMNRKERRIIASNKSR